MVTVTVEAKLPCAYLVRIGIGVVVLVEDGFAVVLQLFKVDVGVVGEEEEVWWEGLAG